MDRIPFGINQLDSMIGGGAPTGSVVLLSGEAGAGSREFIYTSATINGMAQVDRDTFDLYYGNAAANAVLPNEVHYISLTSSEQKLTSEMRLAMDEEVLESGIDGITFHDLSERFFHMSPVPREWYTSQTASINDLRARHEREGFLEALGAKLSEVGPGNLVVIESLSDLIRAMDDEISWGDIMSLVSGIQKAAYKWDGLVLLHLNYETLSDVREGQLSDTADGTLEFEWESGGSTLDRTLVIKQFKGVLSQIEEENIVKFETELGDIGFDISNVRKIR